MSSKGEKLFKPRLYTWVIVLSLSVLCLMVGFWRLSGPYGRMLASHEVFMRGEEGYAPSTTMGRADISKAENISTGVEGVKVATSTTTKEQYIGTAPYLETRYDEAIGYILILVGVLGISASILLKKK